jgi:hypothetical protein
LHQKLFIWIGSSLNGKTEAKKKIDGENQTFKAEIGVPKPIFFIISL